jgi:hypothetical protein
VAKIIVAKIGNLLSKDRTAMNMTFCKYADVFVPAMATDAIHNDLWPGFREDYLLLHCLLRIFEPKRVVEIGTNVGRGTKIIKNAVGPDSQVFSLDLPSEVGPFESSEYQPGRVGCRCDLPFIQLWGDSRTFDFSPYYPIDAFYVDGEHVYDTVYKETLAVIKANAVLAVYHDANEWEVFKGICDAFYGQPTVGYRLYRVIDTRMMFALRNDVPWAT